MATQATDFGGRTARKFKYGTNVLLASLAFFVVLFAINYFAQKSQRRLDLTKDKQFTISSSTENMLKGLKDVVTVTVYATQQGTPPSWTEQREELKSLLYEYRLKSGGHIRYKVIDPASSPENAKAAQQAGMREVPMQQASTTEYSIKAGYLGFVVEYKGKSEKIPALSPQSSIEYQLTRAINKIAEVNIPVIGVLAPGGNPFMGQQSNFSLLPQILEQEGYSVKQLEATNLQELKDVNVLMVFQPEELSEEALYRIDQYVMQGGKLFVAASGIEMDMRQGRANPREPNINSLLEHYGMRINDDLVEDWSRGLTQQFLTARGVVASRNPLIQLTSDLSQESPITKDLGEMIFIFPSSVSKSESGTSGTLEVLAQTSGQAKVQEQFFILQQDKLQKPSPSEMTTYTLAMLASGPLASRFATVEPPVITEDGGTTRSVASSEVIRESSPDARVIAVGNHMSFMDDIISRGDAQINAVFLLNVADSLTRGGSMIALRSKHSEMAQLRDDIPESQKRWAPFLVIGLMPAVLVLFGIGKMYMNRARRARYREIYG